MSAHHHHHTVSFSEKYRWAFIWGIGLNTFFTITEFILGYKAHSMALLADATHNLGDVASLFIAYFGMRLSEKAGPHNFTYGYKKASILASLINSVLLIVLVVQLSKESFERLAHPPEVDGPIIMITAGIGILINLISAWFFRHGQKGDINLKVMFTHLLMDALVSLGAVISGFIIQSSHWYLMDPLMGILIALIILLSSWRLFTQSLRLALDASPDDIKPQEIQSELERIDGILEVGHLHIWALSSQMVALSVHLQIDSGISLEEALGIKEEARAKLKALGIAHASIELETRPPENC